MSSSRSGAIALKWLAGVVFAFGFAIVGWIAFLQPVGTMDWALERVNSHQTQLEIILQIVQKNPDICHVSSKPVEAEVLCPVKEGCYLWTEHGFNAQCARPVTMADRRDYRRIASVMAEIPIHGLQIHRDGDTGTIGSMEFGISEWSLIPWRNPLSGMWNTENKTFARSCEHAVARGWFVCKNKIGWL